MFNKLDGSESLTFLVTGGTGAIGPTLVRRLLEQGHQVRVLARHALPVNTLPSSVEFYQGDITDTDVLAVACHGVKVVFHLAAKLHINNPSEELKAEYQRVNVTGTRNLAEAAQEAGISRLVFFSTISVYGPTRPGEVLDEGSSPQPQSFYMQTKREAEIVALSATQRDSRQPLATVLRLAAVYGPRIKGNYASLVSAIQKRWFIPIGTGTNRRTLVYDRDVASAALLAAEHPLAAGQTYNVTDGQIHTVSEILDAIYLAFHMHRPRYHIPTPFVRFPIKVVEHSFHLVGKSSPISQAMIDKLLEDVAVSGDKIQRELGFQPQYDLLLGWHEAINHTEV